MHGRRSQAGHCTSYKYVPGYALLHTTIIILIPCRTVTAAEFVGMGRRFLGIEEYVAVRCPCCDAVDVDTRHARICPRSGAQVNQHQSLLHAISRTLKRLRIPYQVESGEPFTAGRNLRMNIVIRRGSLRDAPNREYRDKSTHPCRPSSTV